jgi:hypothetical protein
MLLVLEENRDRICLVISLLEPEADHVWQSLSLEIVDLIMTLLFLGSIFNWEAQNTRGRCKP